MPGAVSLKSRCFENLQLEAHSADETALLDEFFDDAKQVIQV